MDDTSCRAMPRTLLILGCASLVGACSHGSSAPDPVRVDGEFVVLEAVPNDEGTVYLNDVLRIRCSAAIDVDSVSPSTVLLHELDVDGAPTSRPVTGAFRVGADAHCLEFEPTLPSDAAFGNGGFRPGQRYQLQLLAGSPAAALRDRAGRGMSRPFVLRFTARSGATPAELFRNPRPGGPRRAAFDLSTTANLDAVPLNAFGAPPLEVRLHFDQALRPGPGNVPRPLVADPLQRDQNERGPVFLEYADPQDAPGTFSWIPAELDLERNDSTGATITLRPIGVLPNHATVRVIVEATLEDIAGESNVNDTTFERVFGTFRTAAAWDQQWNGIVERFDGLSRVDPGANFLEPPAEFGPGWLRAGFAFDGVETTLDWAPSGLDTVLHTSSTQIVGPNGTPITVTGGVFDFRNLTIPQGTAVVGRGPNPLVLRCSGKVTIGGTLSVRGANGRPGGAGGGQYRGPGDVAAGTPLYPPSTEPQPWSGIGACGGGDGGAGSPSTVARDQRGGAGNGPGQQPGTGGAGGYLACTAGCYTGLGYNGTGGGSGGGGGSLATQGDPHYRGATPAGMQPNTPPTQNTAFQQVRGYGGSGCAGGSGTRTAFLAGGEPAPVGFSDARTDNDFWGSGFDVHRGLRIVGEMQVLRGGSGGGGGGDTSPAVDCSPTGSNPTADYRSGGGGGGGGVLIIKALGEIWVTATGHIVADGGHGGGGQQSGACGEAGGGGGGAGGIVVLMSRRAIRLEAHGSSALNRFVYGDGSNGPLAGNDYNFVISADGGVCRTGGFGAVNVMGKYPAAGQSPLSGLTYDLEPLGGFGGMGIVQLMAPPGANADGTNTILDDNIHFYRPGDLGIEPLPEPLGAPAKRQLLAWRGFANADGILVDDFGQPTSIGDNEGDIRPAPILLPCPFQDRSRARSLWIDTGASQRRPLAAPDELARGIVIQNGAEPGPVFEFAGLQPDGYLAWQVLPGNSVAASAPIRVPPTALLQQNAHATFLGRPAYQFELAAAVLGSVANRFVQHEAELQDTAGNRLAGFRILEHSSHTLVVDSEGRPLPAGTSQLAVRARFFGVRTGDRSGLPGYVPVGGSVAAPAANVRIGFAFHVQPDRADPLAGRYPATSEQEFVYDLADAAVQQWLASHRPRYVMWDVTFDLGYGAGAGQATLLPADVARPQLDYLCLPFRW